MVFEKIFGRLKTKQEEMPTEEEIVEVDPARLSETNKISVKVSILRQFSDTEIVQQLLR